MRPVATPQVAELHQENQPANATTALGCVVAPDRAGQWAVVISAGEIDRLNRISRSLRLGAILHRFERLEQSLERHGRKLSDAADSLDSIGKSLSENAESLSARASSIESNRQLLLDEISSLRELEREYLTAIGLAEANFESMVREHAFAALLHSLDIYVNHVLDPTGGTVVNIRFRGTNVFRKTHSLPEVGRLDLLEWKNFNKVMRRTYGDRAATRRAWKEYVKQNDGG